MATDIGVHLEQESSMILELKALRGSLVDCSFLAGGVEKNH